MIIIKRKEKTANIRETGESRGMFILQEVEMGHPIDLDWGMLGSTGWAVRWNSFSEAMRKLRVTKGCSAKRIRTSIEFSPKTKSYAIEKGFREPLKNSKINSLGVTNRAKALEK